MKKLIIISLLFLLPTIAKAATPKDLRVVTIHVQNSPKLRAGDLVEVSIQNTSGKLVIIEEAKVNGPNYIPPQIIDLKEGAIELLVPKEDKNKLEAFDKGQKFFLKTLP